MSSFIKYFSSSSAPNKTYQEVMFRANFDCCSSCSEDKVNKYLQKQADVDDSHTHREEKSIYVKGNFDADKMAKKLSDLLCNKVEVDAVKHGNEWRSTNSSSRASNATAAGYNSTRTHQLASVRGFESHQRESMSSAGRPHRVGASASRSHTRGVLSNKYGGSAAGGDHSYGGGSGGNVTYLGDFGGAFNTNGGGVGGGGSNYGCGSRNYGGGACGARSNYGACSGGGVSNICGGGRGGGNNCGRGSGGGRNCAGGRCGR